MDKIWYEGEDIREPWEVVEHGRDTDGILDEYLLWARWEARRRLEARARIVGMARSGEGSRKAIVGERIWEEGGEGGTQVPVWGTGG